MLNPMLALAALTLMLLAGGVGVAALCRPRSVSGWAALTLCGAWAIAVLLVDGLGRWRYDTPTILVGAGAFAVLGVIAWRRARAPAPRHVWRRVYTATRPWWVRVFLLGWATLMLYSAAAVWVMPPSVPDVLRYHLPMSVAWMREGRVGIVPELDYRANFFPHGVQLLSGLTILMRGDDRMSALPQVALSGVLFPLACYALSRVLGLRRRVAAGSAALAALSAPVILQMRHEVSDVGHYAALLLAVAVAFDGVRSSPRLCARRWIAMGIVTGLALSTKSSGPLVVAALALGWVLARWAAARFNPLAVLDRRFLTRSLGVLAITLGVGSWVFASNTVQFGNPVYPMVMQLGPVTLPGPEATSPLRGNQWIFDFSRSPLERLAGGVARWADLMLSLPQEDAPRAPDFRDNRSPTNSGFGDVTAACTVLSGVFVIASAAVMVRLRRVPRRLVVWAGVAITLGVYNAAYLSMVSLITAPESTVDARYQLHLAYMVALLTAGGVGFVCRRRLALLVAVPLLALGIHSTLLLLGYNALKGSDQSGIPQPHRGWKAFSRMVERDLDRTWAYTGRPYYLADDPGEIYALLDGEDTILLLGRGRVYPLMLPDLTRRVITVGAQGPDYRVDDTMGVDPSITADIMSFYTERRSIALREGFGDDEDAAYAAALEAHREQWNMRSIARNARRYYLDAALANGARYLVLTEIGYYSIAGDGENVGPDPHWELVYESGHRSGRLGTAVYRLNEGHIGSDDFGADPPESVTP